MKLLKIITTGAVVTVLSTAFVSGAIAQTGDPSAMPYGATMDPVMMQNMMRMRQQKMQQNPNNNMQMMDPVMMQNMMRMRQGQMGGSHMGKGNHAGMMKPQMMQMKQQHMAQMEQHLSNIESLLRELVEMQRNMK